MNTHSNSKIFGKVAVITRTKNRNILLPRAINSVLSQTSPEWVHVIINDGGDTEELESTILPFRENYGDRLIVIHNEFSLGMEAASNKAIMAVDSDYIVIHDDDDSWQETFLEETIAVLENNQFPSGSVFAHFAMSPFYCIGHCLRIFFAEKEGKKQLFPGERYCICRVYLV